METLKVIFGIFMMLAFALLVIVGPFYAWYRSKKGEAARLAALKAQWFCPNCEDHSVPYAPLRGSGWITFFLCFAGFVPGVVYFIWRRTGPKNLCSTCGTPVIPANTPKAQRILKQFANVS